MDSADFQSRCKQLKRKHAVCGVMLVALYVLIYARFMSAAWKGWSELFLLILILISAWYLVMRCDRKKNEFLGRYAEEVYSEHFDVEQYQPNGHIERKICRASHLFIRDYGFSLFDLSGSNLLTGRYRGIRFSFSDLTLSKGKLGKRFAAFYVFEHQGIIRDRIMIKSVREPWYSTRPVSGDFDERFENEGNNKAEIAHILNSTFKRELVRIDRIVHADASRHLMTDICIDENRVYIVLWNKENLFHWKYQSIKEIKSATKEDADRITAFLDAFLNGSGLFPSVEDA